jgi:hypothetical protein
MNTENVFHLLAQTRKEYLFMQQTGFQFSITNLLKETGSQLKEYCRSFGKHPDSIQLTGLTKQYCEQYNIWLPNAIHHISCELFLYPHADFDRLLTMMKHLAIDFYLNDVMGRDLFKSLSLDEQEAADILVYRMAAIDETLITSADAQPIEIANRELLGVMKDTSPENWFRQFLSFYCRHIAITHRDSNAATTGHIPNVGEYIDTRLHTSGMIFMLLLVEYSDANFLDWDWLQKIGIAKDLSRLHYVTAVFGALSNDLFSFEKEVIDNAADANLLIVLALNNPVLDLQGMITQAGSIVEGLLTEYFDLLSNIKKVHPGIHFNDALKADRLKQHIRGVERCLQASWMWQLHTQRYKREHSIFAETELLK